MKLVVPLTMPMIRRIRSPASDSLRGRMRGIPPATDDSKRRSTPAVEAASKSSAPQLANSSLLAVTTGLPPLRAVRMSVRAGSIPPMTSTTTSTVGSETTALASAVRIPSGTGASRSRDWLRTAIAASSSFRPVRAAIRSASSTRRRTSAPPTLPQPNNPTLNVVTIPTRVVAGG